MQQRVTESDLPSTINPYELFAAEIERIASALVQVPKNPKLDKARSEALSLRDARMRLEDELAQQYALMVKQNKSTPDAAMKALQERISQAKAAERAASDVATKARIHGSAAIDAHLRRHGTESTEAMRRIGVLINKLGSAMSAAGEVAERDGTRGIYLFNRGETLKAIAGSFE